MTSLSEGFRKLARPYVLILLGALAFGGYVAWLTLDTVRQAPAREASVELPGFGLVRLRLTMDPFPALPTGTVRLTGLRPSKLRSDLCRQAALAGTTRLWPLAAAGGDNEGR